MLIFLFILCFALIIALRWYTSKAYDYVKPEYKNKFMNRIFGPKMYWSKDKYADEKGLYYRAIIIKLMVPYVILWTILAIMLLSEYLKSLPQ